MQSRNVEFKAQGGPIALVFEHVSALGNTLVGTAQLRAGEQVPHSGESAHPADEYSYVLKGRVQIEIAGVCHEGAPGTLMLIPAGEGHITRALEDAEVLWWWVGQPADFAPLKQTYPPPE
ncbi:cupin domain-containing protein [Deinococcus navajonensis]|uniref:Cupin domain-containing protein n=1 Tax=Deinococcus navajonensis TaxID=309884 RepID=A0ABV8XJT9_9DEIO